jgi:transcriptional regulator with XRE-family HTH domain
VATLEEVRLRRRLTQRALAARAGVSLSTIQAIEAGRAGRVRFGTMEKLADVLDVEPEAIDDFAPSFRPRRQPPGVSAPHERP